MPESSKRIIVDGVDFANVFQFHRILRAIAMAVQPPRLIIALLMVMTLMTAGHVWDALTTPTINPTGFLKGPIKEAEATSAQRVIRYEMNAWNLSLPTDIKEKVDAREALNKIRAAAIEQLAAEDANHDRISARYTSSVNDIEAVRPRGTFEATTDYVSTSFNRMINGVISLDLRDVLVGAYSLFVRTPVALWQRDVPFAIVYGLLFVLVVAIGGGAIARMVACEMATGERLRIRDAVDFALESWPRLILTPLLPLIIVAALCLLLALTGAVGMLPWIDVIGGVLYGLALLLSFVIAVLIVGYAAGFSLLIPAVACENCDAADAQQRGYAYVISRPLHLLGYVVTALVGLTIGYVFVVFFALIVVTVTTAMLGLWNSNPAIDAGGDRTLLSMLQQVAAESVVPTSEEIRPVLAASQQAPLASTHERWATSVITVWQTLVSSLVVAFVVAYYFASSTIMYLLIRKKCDGQDPTEIWRPGMIPGTFTPIPDQDQNDPAAG